MAEKDDHDGSAGQAIFLFLFWGLAAGLALIIAAISSPIWSKASNFPAWIQAIGSVIAIGTAVYIGHRNHKHSERVFEEERSREESIRHLRAHSLAHALYPELIEIQIIIEKCEKMILSQIEQRGYLSAAMIPVNVLTQNWKINIPDSFRSADQLLYLLGTDTTPCISELLSLLHQHNRAADVLIAHLNDEETFAEALSKFQNNEIFANRFQFMKKDAKEAVDLVGKIRDKKLLPDYVMKSG